MFANCWTRFTKTGMWSFGLQKIRLILNLKITGIQKVTFIQIMHPYNWSKMIKCDVKYTYNIICCALIIKGLRSIERQDFTLACIES